MNTLHENFRMYLFFYSWSLISPARGCMRVLYYQRLYCLKLCGAILHRALSERRVRFKVNSGLRADLISRRQRTFPHTNSKNIISSHCRMSGGYGDRLGDVAHLLIIWYCAHFFFRFSVGYRIHIRHTHTSHAYTTTRCMLLNPLRRATARRKL